MRGSQCTKKHSLPSLGLYADAKTPMRNKGNILMMKQKEMDTFLLRRPSIQKYPLKANPIPIQNHVSNQNHQSSHKNKKAKFFRSFDSLNADRAYSESTLKVNLDGHHLQASIEKSNGDIMFPHKIHRVAYKLTRSPCWQVWQTSSLWSTATIRITWKTAARHSRIYSRSSIASYATTRIIRRSCEN